MSIDAQQALTQWLAFMLCVAAGFMLSRRASLPETPLIWVALAIAVFAFGFIPILQRPVIILRAPVPIGMLLWGVGIGVVARLMVNQARNRKGPDETGLPQGEAGSDGEPDSENEIVK